MTERKNVFVNLFNAVCESRMRQAAREVSFYRQTMGPDFTEKKSS